MSGSEVSTIPRLRQVHYDTYANLPTTGLRAGDLGYATDRLTLYRWSGAAWQSITIHSAAGLLADIPAAAAVPDGSLYYCTDTTVLKMQNGGAWVDMPKVAVTTGTYTGDDTVNRAIPHGLGVAPKILFILCRTTINVFFSFINYGQIQYNLTTQMAVTMADATNIYVGNAGSYVNSANLNASLYTWVAIG